MSRVTAEDLIAVQLLSVTVPADVADELLEGELGVQLSEKLEKIGVGVGIDSLKARSLLVDGGTAYEAWKLLKEPDGRVWVIASKVPACKRPALVPVYDRVVQCVLSPPTGQFWIWRHTLFARDFARPAVGGGLVVASRRTPSQRLPQAGIGVGAGHPSRLTRPGGDSAVQLSGRSRLTRAGR